MMATEMKLWQILKPPMPALNVCYAKFFSLVWLTCKLYRLTCGPYPPFLNILKLSQGLCALSDFSLQHSPAGMEGTVFLLKPISY